MPNHRPANRAGKPSPWKPSRPRGNARGGDRDQADSRRRNNSCILCHTSSDTWDPEDKPVQVSFPLQSMQNDVHWQKGLRCQDCHGGDPTMLRSQGPPGQGRFPYASSRRPTSPASAGVATPTSSTCGVSIPSPRTDQLAEYWTSGHGEHLKKGDTQVATCISCHDQPHGNALDLEPHGIRPVNEPASPVYHTKVAQTCAKCHSDKG